MIIYKRLQDGGTILPSHPLFKKQNPYLVPEHNQPMMGRFILPDPTRPRMEGTNATEYKMGVGFDDGDKTIPTVVGGQWLGPRGAIERYRITGEEFLPKANPRAYSNFYDLIEKLHIMR